MSELIQMENPTQSQAEMRAETPEDDLLKALEESEGDLGKVNKPEFAVEQVIPEVIPATEPVIQEVATPGPPITNPEDIMPRGFEFKPSPDAVKLPSNPTPNTPVAFLNPESEPTVVALTKEDSSTTKIETSNTEALADTEALTLEEEGEAIIARKKAEEAELASTKIVHTNSGNFIGDDSETIGITSPPPDGEDGLRRDDSLAQGSRSISIEIDKTGGGTTMPPQQVTPELSTSTPEPVVAEMSNAELTSGVTTPALDTWETASESEVAQDSRVVSELVAQPLTSESLEQTPTPEAPPVNETIDEPRVVEIAAEPIAPAPKIEEIRSEVVSSEVSGAAPSPEPEADVIDFNRMREATAKANEGLVADIQDTQKNFEGKLADAGVPETGSADFRTMQQESDALGSELGAQIDDTQEKFENLQDKLENQRQEILKNAQEVMAAASADIQRAQEERDRTEEALIIEEKEIDRKRSENEEKFSRTVEKNNPILERSHQLISAYSGSSSDQALPSESLEKTA